MTRSAAPSRPPESYTGCWPEQSEEYMAGMGCPMCGNDFVAEDIGWGILLRHGEVANAYLRRSGQVRGRCVLIHRGRHVTEPTRLPEPEAAAFWRGTLALRCAIGALYQPMKINYLTLGNKIPHLRSHVFSRRVAGADPARPRAGSSPSRSSMRAAKTGGTSSGAPPASACSSPALPPDRAQPRSDPLSTHQWEVPHDHAVQYHITYGPLPVRRHPLRGRR